MAAVPVVAAGAGLAIGVLGSVLATCAVISAVPAVTCGPLALAYEPVRRVRRKNHNPFAKPAGAGLYCSAAAVGMCAFAVFGNDSD